MQKKLTREDVQKMYMEAYGEDTAQELQVEDSESKVSIDLLGAWNSQMCAMALFTANQDVVIEEM